MTKVLLIEDRTEDAARVAQLLTARDDFEVAHAKTVDDGIEQLAYESYDVVLLRLRCAGGQEFPGLCLFKDLAPVLPVVLLCTDDERDQATLAMHRGAEDFVEESHLTSEVLARSIRYSIERAEAAAQLAFVSRNDPLTGLVNRSVFRERVSQALARCERSGKPGALLLIDLDSFRAMNDNYGSDAGDLLLQHIGQKLSSEMRPYDVVARLDGDEFGILLEDVEDARDAHRISERVLEAVTAPLLVNGREIVSTVSIGAVIFPADGAEPSSLMRNAGFALDRAKRQGGDNASFYMDVFGGARGQRVSATS